MIQREKEAILNLNLVSMQRDIQIMIERQTEENKRKNELEKTLRETEVGLNTLHSQTDSIRLRISVLTNNIQLREETQTLSNMIVISIISINIRINSIY